MNHEVLGICSIFFMLCYSWKQFVCSLKNYFTGAKCQGYILGFGFSLCWPLPILVLGCLLI